MKTMILDWLCDHETVTDLVIIPVICAIASSLVVLLIAQWVFK
jgi:hypothetical protein